MAKISGGPIYGKSLISEIFVAARPSPDILACFFPAQAKTRNSAANICWPSPPLSEGGATQPPLGLKPQEEIDFQ